MPESGRSSEWFRTAFREYYPYVYPQRGDQAAAAEVLDLVEHLGLRGSGALVLDVGCGTGRHVSSFADAGLRPVGLDLSEVLLSAAARRPGLQGRMVLGDMRSLPFQERFDLVVSLFTSFGYFDDRQNRIVLREMTRVLAPGGSLVIDHINAQRLSRVLVAHDWHTAEGYVVEQRRRIARNRVQKDVTLKRVDGSQVHYREDVRLYSPGDLTSMFHAATLDTVRVMGAYDGTPYGEESERMIIVGKKG